LKLPNGHLARIDPDKLQGYVLSDTHPVGRFKAAFFRGLGYSVEQWELLAAHLLEAVELDDAVPLETSAYGTKYVVRCTLSGQPGLEAEVDSIWIVGPDGLPRFITAYPAG
jgi:hypothetical protein